MTSTGETTLLRIRSWYVTLGRNQPIRFLEIYWFAWLFVVAPWVISVNSVVAADSRINDEHWAFVPLNRPSQPMIQSVDRVRTPIDSFVLAKLESQRLSYSPEAVSTTLLRRVFYDLVGLPPPPSEVDTYLACRRPDVFERLIDRLLASSHFGERWAQHWFDVAGFLPERPNKRHYRDYVIGAFNQDKPYDQFLTEQLAGDELVDWRTAERFTPEIKEMLSATGFLLCARDDTNQAVLNILSNRHQVVFDTIENVGSSLLGLTMQCVRCHSHKYEPIPQQEYYQLMALLTPAFNVAKWLTRDERVMLDVSPAEKAKFENENTQLDQQIAELKKQLEAEDQEDSRASSVKTKIAELEGKRHTWSNIPVLIDTGPAPKTHLLKRGNYQTPGQEVEPGFLSILDTPQSEGLSPISETVPVTSGRRRAFAIWLNRPDTPANGLVTRVQVNRIWQHLLGRGIVTTPGNFGRSGSAPTHPRLIEWLACELGRYAQQGKPLIRQIMMSTVYRQTSSVDQSVEVPSVSSPESSNPQTVDPENQWLWRMRLRRLESEIVRDAILATSGQLDHSLGGPTVSLKTLDNGLTVIAPEDELSSPADRRRRSLYLRNHRGGNADESLTFLTVFDQPVVVTNCPCRRSSAVVLQSLAMLNDGFVVEQADQFAQRLANQATGAKQRVELAYRLALTRVPTPQESEWCVEFLQKQQMHFTAEQPAPPDTTTQALASLCRVLFNMSNFLYVE